MSAIYYNQFRAQFTILFLLATQCECNLQSPIYSCGLVKLALK